MPPVKAVERSFHGGDGVILTAGEGNLWSYDGKTWIKGFDYKVFPEYSWGEPAFCFASEDEAWMVFSRIDPTTLRAVETAVYHGSPELH